MLIQKELYRKGKEALLRMDFNEATSYFSQSYRKENCHKALDYLLYSYLNLSDYKQISRILEQKIPLADFSLFTAYWFQWMTGELNEAGHLLDRMLESKNLFLRTYAVKELYKNGKIRNIQDAVRKYIYSAGLFYELALEEERASVYLEIFQGRFEEAAEIAIKLIRQYPKIPDLYMDYIDVLSFAKKPEELEKAIQSEAIRLLAEEDFRLMLFLARGFYCVNKMEQSKFYLKKLLTYFRNNPLIHYHLANIDLSQGSFVKAIQGYEQAIQLAPLFERAYYNMGISYYRLGELVQSGECFEKALSIEKRNDSLFNLSVCLIEKRNLRDAYFYLNKIPSDFVSRPLPDIKDQIRQMVVYT